MQTQTEQHQPDTADLYFQMINIIDQEEEQQKDTYNKIRYGIKHKFDIYHYINQTSKMDTKKGTIVIGTEELPLTEYWTEIEQRRIQIQKYLDEQEPDELAKPRGI